ncbi:mitochondrial inner-membrane-bound regulator-domain-containing protein [Podospora didyma]|uniref:Mitochondrial inner-membrane-bound regulator-domain-containing protein n=1 Tax=Podospora didyma TaxID=330526 RepID=A0AAE0P4G5_9PEZI|nr:mitochondrial inner-membrane-bound regulator-domain-containing protein [Podospora didyma]
MLGRKVSGSGGFVCLQCRLQLGVAARTRQPFPPIATNFISTIPSRRRLLSGDANVDLPTTSGASEPDTHSLGHGNNNEDATGAPIPQFRLVKVGPQESNEHELASPPPRRPNRPYESHGRRVFPKHEELDIAIMGRPGAAIIMQSSGQWGRGKPEMKSKESNESRLDLFELVEKESIEPSASDVLVNIHELKPDGLDVLSEQAFNALKDTLVDGFTKAQLASYIHQSQAAKQFKKGEDLSSDPPWVLERYAWVPAAEPVQKGSSPLAPKSPKARLVAKLMQDCWGVYSEESVKQQGHLDLKLRDIEFGLLLTGTNKWLRDITRDFLKDGKQIELIRPRNFMSITAPRQTAELVLREIHKILDMSRTSRFDASLISKDPIDPVILQEAGRITNTSVFHDPSTNQIFVSWIHKTEQKEDLEVLGDVVLRFLLHACGCASRSSHTLQVLPNNHAVGGRYLAEHGCDPKLPWQERLRQWARWAIAVPKSGLQSTSIDIPANILPHPLSMGEHRDVTVEAFEGDHIPSAPQSWSEKLETETRAIFGHVVQAQRTGFSPSTTLARLEPSLPRTFVPVLPPLRNLSLSADLHEKGLWQSTVVIRFVPSPHQAPEILATMPPTLELLLDIDHHEVKNIIFLRAVADTFVGDVLLPAEPVDVRLVQTRFFTMLGPNIGMYAAPVIDFLDRADMRPAEGVLKTPPELNGLALPRRLLGNPSDTSSSPEVVDSVTVDYLFASLEMERIISTAFHGFKVSYRSIEAGQRGGRRSEISLDAVRMGADEHSDSIDQHTVKTAESFMSVVSNLAKCSDPVLKWQTTDEMSRYEDM